MSLSDFEIVENFLPTLDVASFLNDSAPETEYRLDDKAIELLKLDLDSSHSSPLSGPSLPDSSQSSPLMGVSNDTSSDEEALQNSSPFSWDCLEFNHHDVKMNQSDVEMNLELSNLEELLSCFVQEPPSTQENKKKNEKNGKNGAGKEKDDKKSGKKRARSNANGQGTSSDFKEVTREELLKMNSKEIESYMQKIASVKHLTIAQDKELKKIRRLIKNREYAASSRMKKKNYVDDVEKQLSDARNESRELRDKVQSLEVENKTLKYQLAQIGAAMKKDPELMTRLKQAASSTSLSSTPSTSTTTSTSSNGGPVAKKLKTSVVPTLFIMFFSFVIFFNLFSNPFDSPSQTRYSTSELRRLLENREGPVDLCSSYAPLWFESLLDSWGVRCQDFLSNSNLNASNSEEINPTIQWLLS